ncbi:MAG: SUMF1/EgtB/PvdO family nonheme iron enzyme [Acidobacteriota bacterium]
MSADDVDKDELVGQVLADRYEVESFLAEGGMGKVYLATDQMLSRRVVVKIPHVQFLADRGFKERFRREIKSLMTLEHPHVVKVVDVGVHGPSPYALLQYLGGGSLEDRMTRSFAAKEVAEWLRPVADALDFIHGKGFIHRDVKPGNIMFDANGYPFLGDFGIARALGEEEGGSLTQTGSVPGSPRYMAPEVALGKEPGPSYDQYSLAVVVYQALSGKLPHEADTPMAVVTQKAVSPPKPLRPLVPAVTDSAVGAVMRALEKEPTARYGSCREFAEAFVSGTQGKTTVSVPSPPSSPTMTIDVDTDEVTRRAAAAARIKADQAESTLVPEPRPKGKAALLIVGLAIGAAAVWLGMWLGQRVDPLAAGAEAARLAEQLPDQIPGTTTPDGQPDGTTSAVATEPDDGGSGASGSGDSGGQPSTGTSSEPPAETTSSSTGSADTTGGETSREPATSREPEQAAASGSGSSDGATDSSSSREPEPPRRDPDPPRRDPEPPRRDPEPPRRDPEPPRRDPEPEPPRRDPEPPARRDPEPPPVERASPLELSDLNAEEGQTLAIGTFTLEGTADADLVSVRANGESCAVVGPSFACRLEITEGENTIDLEAIGPAERQVQQRLTLVGQAALRERGRNPEGYQLLRRPRDRAEMVLVPGGRARLGRDDGNADEAPSHDVQLSSYLIDVNEVTWGQFELFMRAKSIRTWRIPSWDPGDDHPVVNVTWDHASEFCDWVGARLPTEAEWEHAARGDGGRYPWGERWEDGRANLDSGPDGHSKTAPVGSYPNGRSPYGLNDMAGNVEEWVADWHAPDAYRRRTPRDPTGPRAGTERVIRGGAFHSQSPDHVRVTRRNQKPPDHRRANVGFRCAQDPP